VSKAQVVQRAGIASLAMYDWPEITDAHDRFWAAISARLVAAGIEAPLVLTRGPSLWSCWESPDLTLGQTCGLPFRSRLHDQVTLVGTLDYGLPDAPPGYYYSELVARVDSPGDWPDFIERTLATPLGMDAETADSFFHCVRICSLVSFPYGNTAATSSVLDFCPAFAMGR
jgi:hypothetical protein